MAAKVHAAQVRMFGNVFICKECNAKMRTDSRKITEGKVKCRKCKSRAFRPVSKK